MAVEPRAWIFCVPFIMVAISAVTNLIVNSTQDGLHAKRGERTHIYCDEALAGQALIEKRLNKSQD